MPPHLELVVHVLLLYQSASCLKARILTLLKCLWAPGQCLVPGTWQVIGYQLIEGIHIITPELAWFEIRELVFFDPSRMARLFPAMTRERRRILLDEEGKV